MYPSNEDYSGQFHSPDEFDTGGPSEKKTMTGLEIGVIVGTILAFALVLFFIFYCRHLESRRRAERVRQQLERGREPTSDVKEPEQVTTTHLEEAPKTNMTQRVWARIRGIVKA